YCFDNRFNILIKNSFPPTLKDLIRTSCCFTLQNKRPPRHFLPFAGYSVTSSDRALLLSVSSSKNLANIEIGGVGRHSSASTSCLRPTSFIL
uniref:Uncharacterized protein n=1 Tax=Gasterosteus aculeatus TaxID=69293 RepID=G3NFK0_GASAC